MWVFKYLLCLFLKHDYVGSGYKYCLRCGKLDRNDELQPVPVDVKN
jgi:hypothetical protein